MSGGRRTGDQQNVGRTLKQPCKCDLHWSDSQGSRDAIEPGRLQRREPSQREERHVRYSFLRQSLKERVIVSVCHVVEVLNANDLRDSLRLFPLPGCDVAETEMANQPLTLQFGQHRQGLLDRPFRRFRESAHTQIDDIESFEAKISEIVMNASDDLFPRERGNPRFIRTTTCAHLRNNHEVVRKGMQRFLDDLIGYVRTVEVARVYVVHAG